MKYSDLENRNIDRERVRSPGYDRLFQELACRCTRGHSRRRKAQEL